MKKPVPLLLLLLSVWITGLSLYQRSLGCCNIATAAATPVSALPIASRTLSISDSPTGFIAQANDNLVFQNSGFAYQQPLSENLGATYAKVGDYLKKNPERMLLLTGLYAANEKNTSIYPDLGIARAQSVKKMLLEKNTPENQIGVASELITGSIDSLMIGGISYSFSKMPEKQADVAVLADKLKDKTIALYFDTDAKTLELSESQRAFFADLINFVNKNPNAQIKVSGHTDNVGDNGLNWRLSRERAAFIKKYLSDNNINAAQIVPFGFGPNRPISSNENETGRAKNRRVEVILNKF